MAKPTKKRQYAKSKKPPLPKKFCSVAPEPERQFAPDVHAGRARAILLSGNKWANGTVLHYYFHNTPVRWRGTPSDKDTVRRAFRNWKALGIGLEFQEVQSASEAEVRIGFERDDGHWSYVGRAVLDHGPSERTMNLDKGDNWGIDTAMHEIGHTLGLPHEHQNPQAGIEWNEEAVYDALAQPPNNWDRATTFYNIIRKIPPDQVQGSTWDPDSIMHYPFEAGLILTPTRYRTQALRPAPGLSQRDATWLRTFYPPIGPSDHAKLEPFRSVRLSLGAGDQANFVVVPTATRSYSFRTFGYSDTVMVLFQMIDGEPRFLAGDDDSGYDRNAAFDVKLYAGREYRLRLRLYYQFSFGETAVMFW